MAERIRFRRSAGRERGRRSTRLGRPRAAAHLLAGRRGAIRGIDEKLTIGQPAGSASLFVPVRFSPARQGFTASLELRYDSGSGNGPFRLGWMLSVPSITGKTASGLPSRRRRRRLRRLHAELGR
jgi:hypothetical protein